MNHILDPLERKWQAEISSCTPPPASVGGAQFFAWDEDPQGEGTVVCIGANYGQFPTTVSHHPTKLKSGLASWMSNYRHAVQEIGKSPWSSEWPNRGWLRGTTPPSRPRYFVMSNVVPWITSRAWTLLPEAETSLLAHDSAPLAAGYLADLRSSLPEAFAVGHGIDDQTLPYLPGAVSRWSNWMLYANLSFRQTPSRWNAGAGRFVF